MFLNIITCDPSIYTIDHPDLTVSTFMENTIGIKWVNYIYYLSYLLILPYKFMGESFQD